MPKILSSVLGPRKGTPNLRKPASKNCTNALSPTSLLYSTLGGEWGHLVSEGTRLHMIGHGRPHETQQFSTLNPNKFPYLSHSRNSWYPFVTPIAVPYILPHIPPLRNSDPQPSTLKPIFYSPLSNLPLRHLDPQSEPYSIIPYITAPSFQEFGPKTLNPMFYNPLYNPPPIKEFQP